VARNFLDFNNSQWRVEKNGVKNPKEIRQDWLGNCLAA